MSTKCKFNKGWLQCSGKPQFVAVGGIDSNVSVVNSTTKTALIWMKGSGPSLNL